LAVSEVVLYFSSPAGLASRLSADLAAVPPVEDELEGEVLEDEVLGVVAGAAGVEDELDVELLLDEPQPTTSSAARATLSTSDRRTVRVAILSVGVALVIAFLLVSAASPPDHFIFVNQVL
jgi:hypothetical protein